MPNRLLAIAAMLTLAASASAQPKVGGGVTGGNPRGSTAPAGGAPASNPQDSKVESAAATPPANRGATARKALTAIKGGDAGKGAATGRKPGDK